MWAWVDHTDLTLDRFKKALKSQCNNFWRKIEITYRHTEWLDVPWTPLLIYCNNSWWDCGCHQQKPGRSRVSHSGNSREEEPLKYLPWSWPQMTSGKPEYCSLSKTVRCPNPAVKFDIPLPSSETALQSEQWWLVNKTTDGSAFPPPVDSPDRLLISSDHHRRVCLSLDGN